MKHSILLGTLLILTLILSACNNKEKEESITEGGMKCGAGKCGASMVDGSAILVKKKMNILEQLKEDDTRRECVLSANTTKDLYGCVRAKKTARLSTKCSADNVKQKSEETMKCEAGKCSDAKNIPKKASSSMKCEAGKCGSNM